VAAAAVFAEMAASYYRAGSSVAQRLAQLYQKYGAHIYRAGYYIADPPSRSQGVFAALRQGGQYPATIGGVKVTGVRDLGTGLDTTTPDQKPTLPWTPGDMMVTFYTEHGGTLTLRASATEPKLKYYLEVAGGDAAAAEAVAGQLEGGIEALVQPQVYGLKPRPPS
jgi:phosphomannomutase